MASGEIGVTKILKSRPALGGLSEEPRVEIEMIAGVKISRYQNLLKGVSSHEPGKDFN